MAGEKYPNRATNVPPMPHKKIIKPKPAPGPVLTSQPNVFANMPPAFIVGSKTFSPKKQANKGVKRKGNYPIKSLAEKTRTFLSVVTFNCKNTSTATFTASSHPESITL